MTLSGSPYASATVTIVPPSGLVTVVVFVATLYEYWVVFPTASVTDCNLPFGIVGARSGDVAALIGFLRQQMR